MTKPAHLIWREYTLNDCAEDEAWGIEHIVKIAIKNLLEVACERMAKARRAGFLPHAIPGRGPARHRAADGAALKGPPQRIRI